MSRLGLYVHVPFCPQRCPYCAFAVVTGRQADVEPYIAGVCAELAGWGFLAARGGLDTVFFGGGTPSRLTPAQLARILEAADRHLGLRSGAEITVEANPGSAERGRFAGLRAAGCTRLSLGVQSLRDQTLRLLGRIHTAADAERACLEARGAGFASVSLDLIFSVPGAPPGEWTASLERALRLEPDHVSTYALAVEEGTPFARRRSEGRLPEVPEEEDARDYLAAVDALGKAGYEHYEISNFARPGHRCAHNWDCWTGGEYAGVGLSAHSFLEGRRSWNTADLDDYLARLAAGASPRTGEEVLDGEAARRERLWLGLRTCEGAPLEAAEAARLLPSATWRQLVGAGYARHEGGRLRLTERGFAVADAVAARVAQLIAPHHGMPLTASLPDMPSPALGSAA